MSDAERAAADVFGSALPIAQRYVDILSGRGIEWGLLGPREVGRMWERHVLNSVAVESLIAEGSEIVDVGSGAGLPGIPLAIVRPDLHVTLLEPLLRRANFLSLAIEELRLGNRVSVVRDRAEGFRSRTFDVVSCRAVAALPKLVTWTRHLWPNGELLALKGEKAADELAGASALLAKQRLVGNVVVVRAHPDTEPTHVLRVQHDR